MFNKLTSMVTGVSLKTWVAVAVGGLVLATGLYINSVFDERDRLMADKAVLENQNAALRAEAASVRKTLADNMAALEAFEARRVSSRQALLGAEKELETLNETDKEVCNWGSGAVPDGVWDWLCGPSGALPGPGVAGPPTGSVSPVNPGTASPRP